MFPRQSTSFVMSVDKFSPENVGKYSCKAENISDEIDIGIKLAPEVGIFPSIVDAVEGENVTLECKVTGSHLEYQINWIDEFEFTKKSVKTRNYFKSLI